jgi:predicted esterase
MKKFSLFAALCVLPFAACSSDSSGDDTNTGDEDTAVADAGDTSGSDAGADTAADAAPDVPAGPTAPAPKAYSGGECPTFTEGTNTFTSDGRERDVRVFLPPSPEGAGFVTLWHGAGDSASNFSNAFDAQGVADEYNVVVFVPSSTGLAFEWPILAGEDTDIDAVLFDDLVACADEQFDINNNRVYTTGFSAGALWSTWLLMNRAEYLAAVITFSGGTDASVVLYSTPAEDVPVLAIHGGPSDTFAIINFSDMTEAMVESLTEDGHPIIMCDHGRGHTIPFNPYDWAFPWLFAQSWGEPDMPAPLPSSWPAFCEIIN